MATGTAGDTGHRLPWGVVHNITARISYADWSGTNNDRHVVGVLPPRAIVLPSSACQILTGFNDTTGDDLDVGVSGDDDDLFHSGCDANSAAHTIFDDLTAANSYATTARTVTVNFTTAPTGDGSAGEAVIIVNYVIAPSAS